MNYSNRNIINANIRIKVIFVYCTISMEENSIIKFFKVCKLLKVLMETYFHLELLESSLVYIPSFGVLENLLPIL